MQNILSLDDLGSVIIHNLPELVWKITFLLTSDPGKGSDVRSGETVAMAQLKSDASWLGEWIDFKDDGRRLVSICQRKYDLVPRKYIKYP